MHAMTQPKPTTDLLHETHTLPLRDGNVLAYRAWHPGGQVQQRAVILFHGGHEHSGRFHELAAALDLPDTSIFAWDARGHGTTPGERGYASHFMEYVRDADEFVRHIADRYGITSDRMVLLGHSVGSVIASTYVHDYAPPVRGLVLGSPAFRVKLYVPLALSALRLWQRLKPHSFVNSYVRPGMLTHDRAEAKARRNDPLISPQIAVPVLTSLFDTAERVIAGAGSITAPTLLLSAGKDYVVHTSAHQRFFERLGAGRKVIKTLPGFYHEVFHEAQRHQAIRLARGFIQECFDHKPETVPATRPDNLAEADALKRPLPATDLRRYGYAVAGAALHSVGRLSSGVRLGLASGFDSGRTLDYVYANHPAGITPIGRALDRAYLNSVGWRGIRQRSEHLRQLLGEAITAVQSLQPTVHIADLAGGPGRYLQEVLSSCGNDVSAVCRDWDEAALAQGRTAAAERGLRSIQYERGDAFDPDAIAALNPQPDIVVVSGLYELFDDNSRVLNSLQAIARRLPAGGRLIVTNQPYHPQLAFIARVLNNRDGERWVMRPRSAAELNRLLAAAGFAPRRLLTDDTGIFTATLAQKV